MQIITSIEQMQRICQNKRQNGLEIGLVPTMGYLHQGHISLMEQAVKETDFRVATIFVNPSQFGPNEDLDRYPRDLDADMAKAEKAGIDILFCPQAEDIYPPAYATYISPEHLENRLCGKSRPGHFRGVCTICLKLFNIIQPHRAYFGKKDAQQFLILKRMIKDLNLNIDIIGLPIVREEDGLAMSSRNVYLSDDERKQALCLSRGLKRAQDAHKHGQKDAEALLSLVDEVIKQAPLAKLDYLELVDREAFLPLKSLDRPSLLAVAVYFGQTRLIDNIMLD